MTLLDAFQRLEETAIGETIRQSYWLFPVIEAVHLVGLALVGGTVIVVNLRLLNLCLTSESPQSISKGAAPYFLAGIGIMFATGIPLALSEMIKLYYNFSFWVKISTLSVALIYTAVVYLSVVRRERGGTLTHAVLAVVSLGLWFTVAGAGRWIGFS